MRYRRLVCLVFPILVALLAPGFAGAQTSTAGAALDALTFSPKVFGSCPPFNGTAGGCYQGLRVGQTTGGLDDMGIADVLRLLLGIQTQTFPVGSSASGFTFAFDPSLGVPTRTSEGFGPIFGERGLTNGRNNFSFSFNYQNLEWQQFNGIDMREGEGTLPWGDFNYDGFNSSYAGEIRVNIRTQTATFAFNYGITDSFDVGLAVPFVTTEVEGSNEIIDFAGNEDGSTDYFAGFPFQGRFEAKGTSTGIGDIVARLKYNFFKGSRAAFAIATDLRLPTGSYEKMIGSREFQPKLSVIGSIDAKVSPHGNVGYMYGGNKSQDVISITGVEETIELPLWDEVSYNAGLDFNLHSRVTFAVDVVGRLLLDAPNYRETDVVFNTVGRDENGAVVVAPFQPTQFEQFREDIHILLGAVGGKIRLGGSYLISVTALIPLNSNGVKPRNSFNIGLDYAF